MSNLMEIVFVLDQSGSMAGSERDVIGGFNIMIKEHLDNEQNALVTTTLFDTTMTLLHDRTPIERIDVLTNRDYRPSGGTALLDALGETIKRIKTAHRYSRKEDLPRKTLFVVMTDGEENSSRHYSNKQIQQLVKRQEEKYHWEFLFIGADIDAFSSARDIGIRPSRAISFSKDEDSFEDCFECVRRLSYSISMCEDEERVSDEEVRRIFSPFHKNKK